MYQATDEAWVKMANDRIKRLTLDDGQCAPLQLSPAGAHKPLLHFPHQLRKVFRVRLHDLVKLSELSRPKEDLCQSELELVLVETECFK